MAEPFRGPKISRRSWLLAGLGLSLFRAKGAGNLIVTFDGDNLHVSSLGLHFLQGKSLSRLKEGSTVEYVAQVTLYRDAFISQLKRSEFRFAVSYDIMASGDQFAVSTPGPPSRRITNLSQSATETWCLDRVRIAAAGIAPDRQFWMQLELRAQPPKMPSVLGDTGIFVDLVERMSRLAGNDERQTFSAGPLRLADLAGARKGQNG